MTDPMKTSEAWNAAARDLGIDVAAPFALRIDDARS